MHRYSTAPIPTLVRELSVPVSIGMFFQTMFNVVDNWAAGKISVEALAALSSSFPVFFLLVAFSHGVYAATNALISQALGQGNHDRARELAGQSLFFGLIMSLLVGFAGYVSTPWLFQIIGIEGQVLEMASRYVRILFLAAPGFVIAGGLNGMLVAHGHPAPFRDSLIATFLLNIIFDPWFVFGGFGLPAMGFDGIALSTALLQTGTVIFLWICAVRQKLLPAKGISHIHPRLHTQRRLLGQGFPAMLNMMTICVGLFVFSMFAAQVSTEVLAAFGTAMRIEQLVLLPTIGLNTASMTLAGHSFGAGRLDRLRSSVLTCYAYGGIIYLCAAPFVVWFAPNLMSFFTSDIEVIRIGTGYLRIGMLIFYAFVLLFVSTSALQGIQRPQFAVWLGIYRQLIAPMLFIPYLMQRLNPPEAGIWWGAFLSVWSGALITVAYVLWVWRNLQRSS